MSSGACHFASARHVPDMSRHVETCLADMSSNRMVCQRSVRGADADISEDADMSSLTLVG